MSTSVVSSVLLSTALLYVPVLYNPARLPAVLAAVVNVVNGSFRADAASSLIVTRGFMGNLPVNFSTYSTLLCPLYQCIVSPSKFKLSGKWPACNAIQHDTLPSLLALHFSAIVWVLATTGIGKVVVIRKFTIARHPVAIFQPLVRFSPVCYMHLAHCCTSALLPAQCEAIYNQSN